MPKSFSHSQSSNSGAISSRTRSSSTTAAAGFSLSLADRDAGLLWHPYAPLNGPESYAVLGAQGVRLTLEDSNGRRFDALDAMGSWWCMVHGYRNPILDAALKGQIERFSHVMFGGLTHEPAIELAEKLVDLTSNRLPHVFFADSGSVSVEVALKLAVQFQAAKGRPARSRFMALRGGYHGDTVGAMSVCDPVDGMHSAFPGLVANQEFLAKPPAAHLVDGVLVSDSAEVASWIAEMEAAVALHEGTLAAIILEPVLQGAGGMHIYAPECLAALRGVATRYGLLLIADEIATGLGRTGKLFGCDWADVTPDIMCVGKALTGGYMSLAAMMCSRDVASVLSRSEHGALLHGPTFMANPLACAVSSASLDLLAASDWQQQLSGLEGGLSAALAPASSLNSVKDVRVLGGTGTIQLNRPVDAGAVARAGLEHGVWLRPFRDLVYAMPPYVSTEAEIATMGTAMVAAVAQVHG